MPTIPHRGSPLHPVPTPLDAVRAFRALAAPHRVRVIRDPEGWPVIPGKLGRIEWHDERELAFYSNRSRLVAKLWVIPGVRRWQTGDREMRALGSPEALDQIAGVIRARRRRRPNAGSFQTPGSA